MALSPSSRSRHGVSVIVCTKRRHCMHTLLRNYGRQNYKHKELIVILNDDSLKLQEYAAAAKPYKNVRICRLPGRVSLGSCLNYGVELARYSRIAKFDDDDYYAPDYLTDSMRAMAASGADIAGKRAHYMQVKGSGRLLLRYAGQARRFVPLIQGATLLVKRDVFRTVRFPDRNRGECVAFCARALKRGFRIYSGSPRHFLAIRRKHSRGHTWIVSEAKLMSGDVKVLKVQDIRRFISR